MPTAQTEYITTPSGKKKAVILPIREYEQMIEDLHDLAVVAERREEYPLLSLSEMKQRISDHAAI